ncbi:hypothetical protein PybrP1_008925 [[Pythium] brassicae (nom. inval.)]|nr:hypothetical protein PybrP1_008925 [[Pythium] brassicae (nom. inval.)]
MFLSFEESTADEEDNHKGPTCDEQRLVEILRDENIKCTDIMDVNCECHLDHIGIFFTDQSEAICLACLSGEAKRHQRDHFLRLNLTLESAVDGASNHKPAIKGRYCRNRLAAERLDEGTGADYTRSLQRFTAFCKKEGHPY